MLVVSRDMYRVSKNCLTICSGAMFKCLNLLQKFLYVFLHLDVLVVQCFNLIFQRDIFFLQISCSEGNLILLEKHKVHRFLNSKKISCCILVHQEYYLTLQESFFYIIQCFVSNRIVMLTVETYKLEYGKKYPQSFGLSRLSCCNVVGDSFVPVVLGFCSIRDIRLWHNWQT